MGGGKTEGLESHSDEEYLDEVRYEPTGVAWQKAVHKCRAASVPSADSNSSVAINVPKYFVKRSKYYVQRVFHVL